MCRKPLYAILQTTVSKDEPNKVYTYSNIMVRINKLLIFRITIKTYFGVIFPQRTIVQTHNSCDTHDFMVRFFPTNIRNKRRWVLLTFSCNLSEKHCVSQSINYLMTLPVFQYCA